MSSRVLVACLLLAHLSAADTVRGQATVRLPTIVGLDEFVPVPADNPLSIPVLELGRRLFFDTRLSHDRTRACVSCHLPGRAFADTVPQSAGVNGGRGRRNAPALINRAWGASFFWDGRAESLEQQVLEPIHDPTELNLPLEQAITRVAGDSSYVRQFLYAFRGAPGVATIAKALATFVRAIRSGNSPLDRYRGGETTALSAAEQRGLAIFSGEARCSRCHIGATFTDEDFHNTGVGTDSGDPGREAVTGRPGDRGKFRTPTVRDLALTAPYMHNGSLPTIEAVIDFYDVGGRMNPNLDRDIRPLGLTVQAKSDLASFLRALSSSSVSCAPISCVP